MLATKSAQGKHRVQAEAREAGLETFAFPCAIHGPQALSDTQYGWCIECRQMTNKTRAAQQIRKDEYRAETLGARRNMGAVHRWRKVTGGNLPAWYGSEREAIERFYAECPEGWEVDHCIPVKGRKAVGLHCLANLQYLPACVNIMKSNKVAPAVRCQRPANEFPGGADDPEQSEWDRRVTTLLNGIMEVIEEQDRREARAAKRAAKRAEKAATEEANA